MASYDDFSDQKLTELLSDGDRDAFTQIFKRYNGILYAHAFKKLGEQENAKDVVQEIFSILWARRDEISFKTNLSGYLYTSVKNKILDLITHNEIKDSYADSLKHFVNNSAEIADHLIREKQLREIIERETDKLPPRMQLIFKMSRNNHLSHKEIAEELKLSEQTVTDQIKKALKVLKSKISLILFWVF